MYINVIRYTSIAQYFQEIMIRSSSRREATMVPSLLNRNIKKRPSFVQLKGRILFLTEDPELIRRQIAG